MAIRSSKPFEGTLEGSHTVRIPEKIALPFIKEKNSRVLIKASFEEKSIEFHSALQKRMENYVITFGKLKQKKLGVFPSDYFQIQLVEDTTKYGVKIPEELQAVLESDPEASEIFHTFTDGKKRSLIYYIKRFKTSQTRIDKALLISENMKMGIRDHRELVKNHY